MHKSKPTKLSGALSSFGLAAQALSKRLSRARRRQNVREASQSPACDTLVVWHEVSSRRFVQVRVPQGFPMFWDVGTPNEFSAPGGIVTPEFLLTLQRPGDVWEVDISN